MIIRIQSIFSVVFLIAFIASCKPATPKIPSSTTPKANFKITKTLPHDQEAFTEGLIYHNGQIIEGTGIEGTSWISVLNPKTLEYSKKVFVPDTFFGEGITLFNNKIYQLTYKSRTGFIYDAKSFKRIGKFEYDSKIKEGWGLTHDNVHLIMSDGTTNLYYLDTLTFEVKNKITVHTQSSPKSNINELEFINGNIYANVWRSNEILKIDPQSGEILDSYDLSGLYQQAKMTNPKIDVLNGIAYSPELDQLIITGKYWPNYYYLSLAK